MNQFRIVYLCFLLISILAGTLGTARAQTLTLSPYSRYGIGDVFSYSSTRNAAMGGIGIGASALYTPNRMNPASYVDFLNYNPKGRFDSRRTTLDISGFSTFSRQELQKDLPEGQNVANQSTAGFRDMSYLFPSNKKVAIAIGFSPYSTVGYVIADTFRLQREDTVASLGQIDYSGRGGLNQGYIGGGTSFLNNKLRVGANLYYAFGNIQYEWLSRLAVAGVNEVRTTNSTYIRGGGALIGVQFQDTLRNDSVSGPLVLRIGGVSDVSMFMNAKRLTEYTTIGFTSSVNDTLGSGEESQNIKIPQRWGVGFELSKPLKWYVGADVMLQNWKNFQYFNDASDLRQDLQIGVGGEFTPDYLGDKYFQRINYRAGAFYHKTYLNYGGRPITDNGISFGIGLPMSKSKQPLSDFLGRFNLSVELGKKGNTQYHLMQEWYGRVRFGITVSERWFVRRVVD
ncbi:MAG: hypothetical protein K1X92_15115 [Bacteroidia bacterium]|nr:hypothetical protein [Bacteroidia bacterium]